MEKVRLKPALDGEALRVYRGGSWGNVPQNARVAYRSNYGPATRYGNLGFRLARNINQEEEQHEKER